MNGRKVVNEDDSKMSMVELAVDSCHLIQNYIGLENIMVFIVGFSSLQHITSASWSHDIIIVIIIIRSVHCTRWPNKMANERTHGL